ncbi:MAG: diguanylate cyclase [Anaerolineales bacterium]|nr:diguanylate cyclase [Anaerolineales bacterium]
MQVNLLYYSAGLGLLVILTAGIAYFAFLRQYKNNTHESTNVTPFILENLRDAIIAVDGKDRITNINNAAKKWLGIKDNSVGMSVFDILPQPDTFRRKWDIPNTIIKLEIVKNSQPAWLEASIRQLHRADNALLGRVIVIHDITQEQELLEAEVHRSAQLGLLEEVGRQVAESFNKIEILQRSIDAVVNRFGYAEAAISLLTDDNMLEVAAIAGTRDFGFRPGFRQEMGKGMIGHTAAIRKTYISKHVANDPYYFSNEEHHGSAICVPILNELGLIGVIYVESEEFHEFNQQDASTLETLAQQVSASLQRASLYSRSQELLRIMSTVQAVSRVISSSLDLETIFESVVKELKKNFGYTHVSIYLLKEDYLHIGAQIGYPEETMFRKIHISQGVHGRTVKTRKAQFIQDVTKEPIYLSADNNISSEICVPLLKDNIVLGTINVEGAADSHLTQSDLDMLTTLAIPITLAVDNARLHAQVKAMAMTDAVSGLPNRHAFEEALNGEVERATRFGHHLSLIIFDLDSFKDYNDEWGHPAGDLRLKATADLVRNNLRKYDMAARYGGDEFAIILPNTDQSSAFEFAKRLHHAAQASTSETPIEEKGVAGYTISMGIATFPNDGNTLVTLLLAADQAALRAKRLGKNQIYLASDQKNNGQA